MSTMASDFMPGPHLFRLIQRILPTFSRRPFEEAIKLFQRDSSFQNMILSLEAIYTRYFEGRPNSMTKDGIRHVA
jgi:hypothetical protein